MKSIFNCGCYLHHQQELDELLVFLLLLLQQQIYTKNYFESSWSIIAIYFSYLSVKCILLHTTSSSLIFVHKLL